MKAELDETGMLTIKPETPTESYALTCWFEDYSNGTTVPGRAALRVEAYEAHRAGE